MKKYLILLLLISCFTSNAQVKNQKAVVLFYNLENLFDTIDDPSKNDEDFLPTSSVAWNSKRYFHKLNNISRAIIASDSVNFPVMIGVAEAENKNVLKDLVSKTPLKKKKYEIILEEGPDPRGIDVGLLYRKDLFKIIKTKPFRGADSFEGRYILYVKAKYGSDTLNIFINHWKSRTGGAAETAPMRMESAVKLKYLTDSIFAKNPDAPVIIMGDFNDEPLDVSISAGLKALPPVREPKPATLYDLMSGPLSRGEGTLYYKDWDLFDQIIVSGSLLNGKAHGITISPSEGKILKKDWMLYKNKQGVMVPDRTASNKDYFGGYSDHLPVYIILEKKP